MRVIIAGSRWFEDYDFLAESINKISLNITTIISGTARGVDQLGEWYGLENNIQVERFPANWSKYGKAAGYIRNKEMANHADALIAFWDKKSKGTKHMINIAIEKELEVIIYYI